LTIQPAVSNDAVLRFFGPDLVTPVLERVVGMLVARAHAPIDRLDDAMLLTDALAAHAMEFTGDSAIVTVATSAKELAIGISPLDDPSARALIASTDLPEVGNVIEHVTSATEHDGDTLRMTLAF
jgi:hypothetical protein